MEESLSFVPLLIVALLAFLVPVILLRFRRLHLHVALGEIVAVIVIGESGFR